MRLYFCISTHLNMYIRNKETKEIVVGEYLKERTIGTRRSHLITVDKIVAEMKTIELIKNI